MAATRKTAKRRNGTAARGGANAAELGRTDANFAPLTPLTFLTRAASTAPRHLAIV